MRAAPRRPSTAPGSRLRSPAIRPQTSAPPRPTPSATPLTARPLSPTPRIPQPPPLRASPTPTPTHRPTTTTPSSRARPRPARRSVSTRPPVAPARRSRAARAAAFNGAGITTPVPGDQTTSLRATATDSASNASGCSSALAYTEDSSAPQTQIDSGPQGPTNDPTPSFGFSATGGAQSFECRFDSASFGPCSGPGDTHTASPQLSDGAHTFEVRATDSAQNTDQTPATRSFTVDTSAPQTQVDSGPQGPTANSDPSFGFSSSESNSSFECRLDGPGAATGTFATCTSPRAFTDLADGAYTFEVRATDEAQNTDQTPATRSFTVDTSAPQTQVDSGPQGPTANSDPSFGFSSSESNSSFECRLDGPGAATGTFATCTSPRAFTDLADGAYTFEVRASDSTQNTDPTPASRSFTVDTSAPAAPNLTDTDPDSPANDNNPELKGSAEAGSTVRIYSTAGCTGSPLASGTAGELDSPGLTVNVAGDQTTSLRARAEDRAGNESGCSAAIEYTEDSTPPESEITDAPAPETTKRKVEFAFSSSEANSTFRCSLDKATIKHCESPLTKRVSRGRHVFRVYALDPSGNAESTPAKAKFKVLANK